MTPPPNGPELSVLVVDDDEPAAAGLERWLRQEGHRALRATTAEQAFALARQEKPQMILLSDRVPGGDGLAVLPRLMLAHAPAAVVVLARDASIAGAVEATRQGAVDYLVHPASPARLKALLDGQAAPA